MKFSATYMLHKLTKWSLNNGYMSQMLPRIIESSYNILGTKSTNYLVDKTIYKNYCGSNNMTILAKQIQILRDKSQRIILHLASENIKTLSVLEYKQLLDSAIHLLTPDDIVAIKLTSLLDRQRLELTPDIYDIIDNIISKQLTITIDAEESEIQGSINQIVDELMRKYNLESVKIYKTYQCYLKTTMDNIQYDLQHSEKYNYHFGAKLVRGAYLEWERKNDTVWSSIEETHACYNAAVDMLISKNIIIATHNNDSAYKALKYNRPDLKFAQLLGMNDNLSTDLVRKDQIVYKFVPFGPTEVVLPYLVRRLHENSHFISHLK